MTINRRAIIPQVSTTKTTLISQNSAAQPIIKEK
jgi:hypothetical protein